MHEWRTITEDQLRKLYYEDQLSDQSIADMYNVTRSTVTRKRDKYQISHRMQLYKGMEKENPKLMERLNRDSYHRLMKNMDIDSAAKALTHYAFRNGPVEDIHADGKLSEDDMKTLNQFMVNRLAGIFELVKMGEWLQLELLYSSYRIFGSDWDQAEPDHSEAELILKNILERS